MRRVPIAVEHPSAARRAPRGRPPERDEHGAIGRAPSQQRRWVRFGTLRAAAPLAGLLRAR